MNCSHDLIEAYMDEDWIPDWGRRRGAPFKLPESAPKLTRDSANRKRVSGQSPLLHRTGPIAAISPRGAAAGGSQGNISDGAKYALALACDCRFCSSRNIGRLERPWSPISNCGKRSGRTERPLRSYPLVDRNPSAGCALFRSAHSEAVVQWQARLFA